MQVSLKDCFRYVIFCLFFCSLLCLIACWATIQTSIDHMHRHTRIRNNNKIQQNMLCNAQCTCIVQKLINMKMSDCKCTMRRCVAIYLSLSIHGENGEELRNRWNRMFAHFLCMYKLQTLTQNARPLVVYCSSR